MKKTLWGPVTALLALCPAAAQAEPIGRWFDGPDQGLRVYGIVKDPAGFDSFKIVCGLGETRIRVTVGSAKPNPRDLVKVFVDGVEFDMFTQDDQEVTPSGQDGGKFVGLWIALRRGKALRVQLASGGSTEFTLRGANKVIPPQPCGPF